MSIQHYRGSSDQRSADLTDDQEKVVGFCLLSFMIECIIVLVALLLVGCGHLRVERLEYNPPPNQQNSSPIPIGIVPW